MAQRMYLVVGGTSGLGEATARALASRRCSVVIAGRNADRGAAIVDTMRQSNPDGKFKFERVDLSRIKDTLRFAERFKSEHSKLDGLVITAGIMRLSGRVETEEGLDEELATHHYGRVFLIQQLLPLLETGKPLESRVVSVLGATSGGWLAMDDLDLKNHYNFIRARLVAAAYMDLTMPELSDRHPNVMFNHVFPGVVATPLPSKLPFPVPMLMRMASFLMTKPETAGNMIADVATDPKYTNAWNLIGQNGNVLSQPKWQTKELSSKIWNHTQEMLAHALK